MRRLLSIAIVLLMVLPLAMPALGQSPQSHVLLCCRRMGAHHCMTVTYTEIPAAHQRCPAAPSAATTAHTALSILGGNDLVSAANAIEELKVRQVEAGYRISFYRSRQKRGPPALVLS